MTGHSRWTCRCSRMFPKDKLLQLRVEIFNALNHPSFGQPGHSFGAPGFGVVSNALPARTLQLGVRFAF